MKPIAPDVPAFDDASSKAHTGRTIAKWFEFLDAKGGLAAGRRALVLSLYDGEKVDEWWATTLVVEYEKARGAVEKDGRPKGYGICVTKTIAAPLADVYAAFCDAKTLDGWLGPKTKASVTDGGTLENADGDRFAFMRVRQNKDLRFRYDHPKRAPDSLVDVAFADKGKGKTGITLNHARIQSRADADMLRAGWAAALEALKRLLER